MESVLGVIFVDIGSNWAIRGAGFMTMMGKDQELGTLSFVRLAMVRMFGNAGKRTHKKPVRDFGIS